MGEIDLGDVSLTKFLNLNPDYVRITPKENQLKGTTKRAVKVMGESRDSEIWFNTEIPITIIGGDTTRIPTTINLHYLNVETFLTLLAHRPKEIGIEYWEHNDCDMLKKRGISNETITFTGRKGRKAYKVSINQPYTSPIQMSASFKE